MWELRGTSSITPVTVRSYVLSSRITLPRASSLPKYLAAVLSVTTTVLGAFRAVCASPRTSLKSNRSRMPGSAK